VALAFLETLDHEHAGQPELAAPELPAPAGHDGDAPRRDRPATDLLAGLGVDHGHRRSQDHPRPQEGAPPDPGPFDDHAAAADHGVVLDDHGGGLRRFEDAADPDPAREVDVGTDLGTGSDGGPSVDHGVGPDARADVHVARH